jgi:predicted transcriptional regulator
MRVPRGREEKKMTDQEANSEIFNKLIANENRADLLMLFRRNPGLIDAVDGIARRIGLQPSGISDDLSELVKIGVLCERKLGSVQIFGYNASKDKELQNVVGNFIRTLKTAKKR